MLRVLDDLIYANITSLPSIFNRPGAAGTWKILYLIRSRRYKLSSPSAPVKDEDADTCGPNLIHVVTAGFTALYCIRHCITHYTALYFTLYYTVHCTVLYIELNNTLRCTTHCTTHYAVLYYTLYYILHCTLIHVALHWTTELHFTTLHCIVLLHYTTLHCTRHSSKREWLSIVDWSHKRNQSNFFLLLASGLQLSYLYPPLLPTALKVLMDTVGHNGHCNSGACPASLWV